ncbi:MAG: hypothetical protein FJ265_10485 [Planctomycetes bacterium]|nr:hypothetical protein [Planctomycetota bacterium]
MKLVSLTISILGLAALASAQVTLTPGAGIEFSRHNFANAAWNVSKPGETCGVCHIPHVEARATARVHNTLLWGRELSAANYTPYTSPTMQAVMGQPSGSSRLCLGCHDGSVALEMFGSVTATTTTFVTGAMKVPGKDNFDFGADHPISIPYLATDPGLRDKDTSRFGPTATRFIKDYLEGGTIVQCSTCHDVHNKDIVPGTNVLNTPPNPMNYLLRMSINNPGAESELCLACHIK